MKYSKYPSYKDSGVEWLGEIPGGWIVTKIKNMLSTPVTDGPHETPEFLDEGVPFVSAEAISKGYINFNKIRGHISQVDNNKYSQKYSPELHDVYMIKSGATTGITAIVDNRVDFNIWSPLAVFRSNVNLEPYYLLNYLRSANFQKAVELYWTYGTQQNIGMNVLENLSISIPPLQEQQTIANYLDKATDKIDTLISKQTRLIELLKEKRQAVISTAVTRGLDSTVAMKDSGVEWLGEIPEHWTRKKLNDVAKQYKNSFVDGPFGSDLKSNEYKTFGTPLIQLNNIKDGIHLLKNMKFITDEKKEQLSRHIAKQGDVVIAKMAEPVARATIVNPQYDEYVIVADCVRLTPDLSKINTSFLIYAINSKAVRTGAELVSTGTTRIRINLTELKKLWIPYPELQEQEDIAKFLDDKTSKMDTLISKSTNAIDLLKEKRTALISAAVTGKIDVRGEI